MSISTLTRSIIFAVFFLFSVQIFAQPTSVTLPTDDNTSSFDINRNNNTNIFKISGDGGFLLSGTLDSGTLPSFGTGPKMFWYPGKSAFRFGDVNLGQWNFANIGYYSFAGGYNNQASGDNSFAFGTYCYATGNESFAFGTGGSSSGDRSLSFNGTASSVGAIALGSGAQAMGDDALALGPSSIANGLASIVLGPSIATGNFAVAIGLQNSASGNFSFALGKNARTGGRSGSFVIGDASAGFTSDSVYSTANNQMTMRFVGGYRLFTTVNLSTGVSIAAGGASWNSISDSTKKENFLFTNGEYFLESLSKLRLGSWNYKSQEKNNRHYGPMAQEIFNYFGKDDYGVIGDDTTLASADMDGIMMIMLQTLEKRTHELKSLNSIVQNQNSIIEAQQNQINQFKQELQLLKESVAGLQLKSSSSDVVINK